MVHRPAQPVVIGACVLLAAVSLTAWASTERERADTATAQAVPLAQTVADLCARGDEVARVLAREGQCALASAVTDAPVPQTDTVSRAEIARMVEQEVSKLALPPGREPNSGQLAEAARRVIEQNPEQFRGADATPERIAEAVAAYLQAHPPRDGEDGEDGQDGADGADGHPPVGWVTRHQDGTVETCGRAEEFDPDQPRYDCTRTAPAPEPTPEPTGGLLGG